MTNHGPGQSTTGRGGAWTTRQVGAAEVTMLLLAAGVVVLALVWGG